MEAATDIIEKFVTHIVNPAIMLIFAFGFLVFMYGLVEFMLNLSSESKRREGAQHMLWGIAGILIMVAVRGIVMLLDNTFQLGALSGSIDTGSLNSINFSGNMFAP